MCPAELEGTPRNKYETPSKQQKHEHHSLTHSLTLKKLKAPTTSHLQYLVCVFYTLNRSFCTSTSSTHTQRTCRFLIVERYKLGYSHGTLQTVCLVNRLEFQLLLLMSVVCPRNMVAVLKQNNPLHFQVVRALPAGCKRRVPKLLMRLTAVSIVPHTTARCAALKRNRRYLSRCAVCGLLDCLHMKPLYVYSSSIIVRPTTSSTPLVCSPY